METSYQKIKNKILSTPCAPYKRSFEYHFDFLDSKLIGINKLYKKIDSSLDNPQQFIDFLTEAHWALILLKLGGAAEYEPLGESGPDIRFSYLNYKIDFHCKHLRSDPKTAKKLENYGGILVEYGNVLDDTISIFNRITSEKPNNIDLNNPQIIAYWSDSERIDEYEFEYAIKDIEISTNDGQYLWISGIIYKITIFKDLRHWYNDKANCKVPKDLQEILRKLKP